MTEIKSEITDDGEIVKVRLYGDDGEYAKLVMNRAVVDKSYGDIVRHVQEMVAVGHRAVRDELF